MQGQGLFLSLHIFFDFQFFQLYIAVPVYIRYMITWDKLKKVIKFIAIHKISTIIHIRNTSLFCLARRKFPPMLSNVATPLKNPIIL